MKTTTNHAYLRTLNPLKIRVDGGTQVRLSIDSEAVEEYAAAIESGARFPPIVVFHDGVDFWLADGFHRWHAHTYLKIKQIDCEVRKGTKRDALLFSASANACHGIRRSNADKRRAVMVLLGDPEWSQWSEREIARRSGTSHFLVQTIRQETAAVTCQALPEARRKPEVIDVALNAKKDNSDSILAPRCENDRRPKWMTCQHCQGSGRLLVVT